MARTFFIADTHFGEAGVFRYESRPFSSVAEMDAEMIRRWNAAVRPEDTVWHLGDFGADGTEAAILAKLNGTKLLVKGNHDTKSSADYRSFGFSEVYDRPVILDSFFLLSHDALYVSANMPYANLFGHVHNSPVFRDFSPHHFCVCVERIDYTPINLDEIKRCIQTAVDKVTV